MRYKKSFCDVSVDMILSETKAKGMLKFSLKRVETRLAEFPTGTVDPRVGIFLSPLNTNDGFFSCIHRLNSFYRLSHLVPCLRPTSDDVVHITEMTSNVNIYILNAIALDESIFLDDLHFPIFTFLLQSP